VPLAVAAAAALVVAVAASATTGGQAAAVVKTRSTALGTILVDAKGRTLYLFAKDSPRHSNCSGQCAVFWPPYLTTAKPRAAGTAKAALLGSVKRADGRLQVTYKGHPLYRFKQDAKAGQTKGEEFDAFGGEWYVVSPQGAKLEQHEDNSGSASGSDSGSGSGSSGGGYGGGGYGGSGY
jgi:predicted lipoprotein with Yx(FWY)xxD motif